MNIYFKNNLIEDTDDNDLHKLGLKEVRFN